MDFDLTDDQKDIKRVARDLLADACPMSTVRAAADARREDRSLSAQLNALGWPGIGVAEQHDGEALGAIALTVVLEELGYACAPTGVASTAIAAAVIQASGTDDDRARWLRPLVSGEVTAGVGLSELAADAEGAAVVVVVDGDDAWLVAGARTDPIESIDPTRRYARVIGGGRTGLERGAADRVRVAIAAELVGVSQRALDMTVAYVSERKQFGVPIGSFQAVAHRCAQMLMAVESARSTAYHAAWTADAQPDRLAEAAAMAAASAADGSREVTASAIQAHGGIGFTWEADVHWLYKRAQLGAALLGDTGHHRRALARAMAGRIGSGSV